MAKTKLKKQPNTIDFEGQLIVLGCGTSVGVPAIGCGCEVCNGGHPRNQRSRCSVILGLPEGNLLIDTSPDLRTQLTREGIGIAHMIAYTHEHTDHIMGFDDLRLMQFYLGHAIPAWCNAETKERIQEAFSYAFQNAEQTHAGAVPAVELLDIEGPFEALGETITPVPLNHGPRFDVLGFRIGNIAYCTDVKLIPESSKPLLQGLDVLILSALRPTPHPTHMSIDEAIAASRELGAKKTYFTHCSCHVDYEKTMAELPPTFEVAYDGLRIPLS
ncbi:MAG: MBL fold metallo-hydrolase [Pirellulaceae bacterium]|nr:MBL fold metallo-hydrolase [Pirellulaceae bacterium]MDG2105264.1 MBL fold metallo-hydrolase [Pirellulaceae bacterium]